MRDMTNFIFAILKDQSNSYQQFIFAILKDQSNSYPFSSIPRTLYLNYTNDLEVKVTELKCHVYNFVCIFYKQYNICPADELHCHVAALILISPQNICCGKFPWKCLFFMLPLSTISPAKFCSTNWRCSRTVLEHLELF